MANTLKLGAGKWATGTDTVLAFNDENNNFKPLPFSFSRASSATVVNQSGLIETVGSGTPRIDFLGNTKGALLLEPTRTNLATLSENFSGWSNISNATVTSNYTISPEGVINATRLQFTGNGYLFNLNSPAQVNGTQYTLSCYAKRNDNETQSFGFFSNGSTTVDNAMVLTNEWKRFYYTYTASNALQLGLSGSSGADVSVYGFQVESNSSYPTSIIPTSGSAVTRVLESNILGSPISLDNNFSLFWDGLVLETDIMLYGSGTNAWYMNYETLTGRIILDEPTSGGRKIQAYLGSGAPAGIKTKILLIRNGGVHSVFANGTKLTANISVNSTSTLSLSSMFWAFSSSFNKGLKVNDSQIFKIALTDAEAIALTTI